MRQSLEELADLNAWVSTRRKIPGLTLADREFARLVAITVYVMVTWELNMLGGRPIKWRKLPMTVTVRPEWYVLLDRYNLVDVYGRGGLGLRPLHDLVLSEAHRIIRISFESKYA